LVFSVFEKWLEKKSCLDASVGTVLVRCLPTEGTGA
jgi:hypothetical protein